MTIELGRPRGRKRLAAVFLDLDRFNIFMTPGHDAEIRCSRGCRQIAECARIRYIANRRRQFNILLTEIPHADDIIHIAQKSQDLQQTLCDNGHEFDMTTA